MAGYCQVRGINDTSWTDFDVDVMIMDYEENMNVVDGEAAGRTKLTGSMIRDPLGTFLGHKITFQRYRSPEAFDALWTWFFAHSMDDYIWLRAADGQTTIDQKVYYTSLTRNLEKAKDGVNYWNSISGNFIAIDPALTPQ